MQNMKNKTSYENSLLIKNRHIGRVLAFQVLFSYDFDADSLDNALTFQWEDSLEISKTSNDYARFLVEGTIRNLSEIDKIISSKLRNWELGRISAVDKSIVRFATFSLMYENDLDSKIIIDEAVEISKQFGAQDSYKFVNGILDAIKKDKVKG